MKKRNVIFPPHWRSLETGDRDCVSIVFDDRHNDREVPD